MMRFNKSEVCMHKQVKPVTSNFRHDVRLVKFCLNWKLNQRLLTSEGFQPLYHYSTLQRTQPALYPGTNIMNKKYRLITVCH